MTRAKQLSKANVEAITGLQAALDSKASAGALGVTGSASDMGVFSGSTIPDNVSAKAGMQALETALESVGVQKVNKSVVDVNVLDYTSNPDGVVDWTSIFNTAIADAATAKRNVYVPGRASAYVCSGKVIVLSGVHFYGDGWTSTIIKRANAGTQDAQFSLGTDAKLSNLKVDGNSSTQTVSAYGILGYKVQRPTVENVWVDDTYGIGVGWSDSADGLCVGCRVTNTKNSRAGYWNDTFTSGSYYQDGRHRYINCEAIGCQLDGLAIGTANNTVIGGRYSENGYGGSYGGALGATGIYTQDGKTTDGLRIIGILAEHNSESGINFDTNYAIILGNRCSNNQLSGIVARGGAGYIISGNVCQNNGWYTGSANPDVWIRAGILFFPKSVVSSITGNVCNDLRGSSATQRYGIYFAANAEGGGTCVGMSIAGNQTRYNSVDNDNINPSGYVNPTLTQLSYDNYFNGQNSAQAPASGTNPDVSNGLRFLFMSGTSTVTGLANGSNTQQVTIVNSGGGTITIQNNSSIYTAGSSNVNLTPGSTFTVALKDGVWYEISRSIH